MKFHRHCIQHGCWIYSPMVIYAELTLVTEVFTLYCTCIYTCIFAKRKQIPISKALSPNTGRHNLHYINHGFTYPHFSHVNKIHNNDYFLMASIYKRTNKYLLLMPLLTNDFTTPQLLISTTANLSLGNLGVTYCQYF